MSGTTASIPVDEGRFRMVGVVIRVKGVTVNGIGDNGPPWRGGTRTDKTERRWEHVPRIMVPWLAVG